MAGLLWEEYEYEHQFLTSCLNASMALDECKHFTKINSPPILAHRYKEKINVRPHYKKCLRRIGRLYRNMRHWNYQWNYIPHLIRIKIASKIKNKIIDLDGKYLFPGFIDSQVHFREPGLTHKEDLESGSKSAILGGVTTFLEMPNTNPATTTVEAINEKLELAGTKSYADFAFFMGATLNNLAELKQIPKLPGCCGIKIFFGSSTGDLLLNDDKAIQNIFRQCQSPIAIHSENEEVLQARMEIRNNATSAHAHPDWRNVDSALSATKKIIKMAKEARKKIHVLHISTKEEIDFLRLNKDICTFEITPQHLNLAAPDCYEQLGTFAQMNPPIREKVHQDALWRAIIERQAEVIGSDHAPHTKDEKNKGYPNSPSGMPGVQTMVPIMFDQFQKRDLNLMHLKNILCTNPAKLYNLRNKGEIRIGNLADFCVIDPRKEVEINDSMMASKCGWTPFHGRKVKGFPVMTILRGKVVMEDQKIVGGPSGKNAYL